MLRTSGKIAVLAVLWACPVAAETVRLTADLPEVRLVLNGQEVVIARMQDDAGPECPPACIQPLQAADGVATLGPIEVIDFLQSEVVPKTGLLLDVRLPAEFATGHVPGALNVPGPTLAADNPYQRDILLALGARDAGAVLEFDSAPALALYAEGPLQDEALRAVQDLVAAGYPAQKLRFFRGGMQEWRQFGLTMSVPAQGG
jgi:rhodanese-related sulfurtransferase